MIIGSLYLRRLAIRQLARPLRPAQSCSPLGSSSGLQAVSTIAEYYSWQACPMVPYNYTHMFNENVRIWRFGLNLHIMGIVGLLVEVH